jgi:hypothetical protein
MTNNFGVFCPQVRSGVGCGRCDRYKLDLIFHQYGIGSIDARVKRSTFGHMYIAMMLDFAWLQGVSSLFEEGRRMWRRWWQSQGEEVSWREEDLI